MNDSHEELHDRFVDKLKATTSQFWTAVVTLNVVIIGTTTAFATLHPQPSRIQLALATAVILLLLASSSMIVLAFYQTKVFYRVMLEKLAEQDVQNTAESLKADEEMALRFYSRREKYEKWSLVLCAFGATLFLICIAAILCFQFSSR